MGGVRHPLDRRNAFTLAEVLITLGIIGIVAAMTIPTLVANYQTKSWNTASTVFERKLEEALKVMNTQQVLSGHNSTEDFIQEFQKYLKINKICKNNELNECFQNSITWRVIDLSKSSTEEAIDTKNLKTAHDLGKKDWNTDTVGLLFANGVSAILAYNDYDCKQEPYSNSAPVMNCISVLYDTSGFSSPNTTGKDIRGMNTLVNSCVLKSGNNCFSAIHKMGNDYIGKDECEQMLADGFGHKSCYGSPNSHYDRWLYAGKYCGGLDKLPTTAELQTLANIIYQKNVNGGYYGYNKLIDNLTANQEILDILSFDIPQNGMYVWAKDEMSNFFSYYRFFGKTSTKYAAINRNNPGFYVFCKE